MVHPFPEDDRGALDCLVLEVCPQDPMRKDILSTILLKDDLPAGLRNNLAHVFYIRSGDAAASAFIPVHFLDCFIRVCEAV